jgi:hypothetical protein
MEHEMSKPTWNDLHEAPQQDLKRIYKLNDRQLEQQVRRHWDGANMTERRKLYEKVYGKKK